MAKLAIVQKAPIFLDKQQTIALVVSTIEEATRHGAELVVFTEAFIPGYPTWVWRLRPRADWGLSETLHHRLLKNAVVMESDDLVPLYEAAKRYHTTIVCGIEERDSKLSQSTLYNTIVTIDSNGELLNKHRKLMLTNPERMVWYGGLEMHRV